MTHEMLKANVGQLLHGWTEKLEYRIRVHVKGCLPNRGCDCPVEDRGKRIRHPGLLHQLYDYDARGDAGGDRAARPAPNKPQSRPPGRVAGLHLLDEIETEINALADQMLIHLGGNRSRALQPTFGLLSLLVDLWPQCGDRLRTEVLDSSFTWVRRARALLQVDQPQELLPDTVCGACGGSLTVGRGASTSVRCAGTAFTGPCGVVYRREDWLSLYEQRQRRSEAEDEEAGG